MGYIAIFVIAAIIGVSVFGFIGIPVAVLTVLAFALGGKGIMGLADKLEVWLTEFWKKVLGR